VQDQGCVAGTALCTLPGPAVIWKYTAATGGLAQFITTFGASGSNRALPWGITIFNDVLYFTVATPYPYNQVYRYQL
jgi:hypothetical protein